MTTGMRSRHLVTVESTASIVRSSPIGSMAATCTERRHSTGASGSRLLAGFLASSRRCVMPGGYSAAARAMHWLRGCPFHGGSFSGTSTEPTSGSRSSDGVSCGRSATPCSRGI